MNQEQMKKMFIFLIKCTKLHGWVAQILLTIFVSSLMLALGQEVL